MHLFHTNNVHVNTFNGKGRGIAIRYRTEGNIWTIHSFTIWQHNINKSARDMRDRELRKRKVKLRVRPTLTIFEWSSWQQEKGLTSGEKRRVNRTKSYIRIKACAGGREIR